MIFWLALLLAGGLAVLVAVLREAKRKPVATRRTNATGQSVALPLGVTQLYDDGPKDAPVLVLVHGLTTPSFVFDGLTPTLLARGWRVIRYDHYGRGLSDRPGNRQTAAFFRDHLEQVLTAMGLTGPITLAGYSMGAAVAVEFAATHPARVAALHLIAPAGLDASVGGWIRHFLRVPVLGDLLMHLAYPASHRRATEAERPLPTAVPDIVDRQQAELNYRGFLAAVLSSLRHLLSTPQQEAHTKLAQTAIKVSVLWGCDDDVIPLTCKDIMSAWNPAADHVEIANAGHGLPYTHAEDTCAFLGAPPTSNA